MKPSQDVTLEVLHDHYKETFAVIRGREKQRDWLFLLVVGLIGLLFLFALFPVEITDSIDKLELSVGGAKVELSRLPLAIPASVAWSVLFVLALRYCQTAVTIERQYRYLHAIEDEVASVYDGDKGVYRREGHAYKLGRPLLTHWAWIFYTIVSPAAGIVLIWLIILTEAKAVAPHTFNLTYDVMVAIGVSGTLLLFVAPQIVERIRKLCSREVTRCDCGV